nr:retrovirus-related Pol polyprotein from transposon TNT 1-94 [Tanacetum cinerariifolium]
MTNGEFVKDMTSKFDKLAKFEGQDFLRWQKKMHFLLTILKVVYVLSTPSPVWSENETLETTRKRMKWEKDDYICRGHILNGQYTQHNLMMDDAISVAVIIDKLPPS